MKIAQAKKVPLSVIVEHLGGRYSHKGRNGEVWYYSCFRPKERTASFKINEHTNRWYDFGLAGVNKIGNCGDTLDLWSDYHNIPRRRGVRAALLALERLSGANTPRAQTSLFADNLVLCVDNEPPRFEIIKLHNRIFYTSLKEELCRRRIRPETAAPYLQQAFIRDRTQPNRKINGIAFQNMLGGYEISIPNPEKETCFKTAIKPKAPTYIEGEDKTILSVFEGFWDFLAWLEMNNYKTIPHQVIVLNSTNLVNVAAAIIIQQKGTLFHVCLYLDNDEAGFQATHALAGLLEPEGFSVCDMRQQYMPHKDVSLFHYKK